MLSSLAVDPEIRDELSDLADKLFTDFTEESYQAFYQEIRDKIGRMRKHLHVIGIVSEGGDAA